MSDRSYTGYGYNRASGCGCGGYQYPAACTLAAPMPYRPACHPAPLHRSACQSDAYFVLPMAYGRW